MKIACIDVGSNSIKLVVVDAAASDSFAVLAREKDGVRLGHETLRQEQLSPSAIERATECDQASSAQSPKPAAPNTSLPWPLLRCAKLVMPPSSSEKFNAKPEYRLELLSPIEEARLIGLAAAQGCAAPTALQFSTSTSAAVRQKSRLMRESIGGGVCSLVKLGAVGLN